MTTHPTPTVGAGVRRRLAAWALLPVLLTACGESGERSAPELPAVRAALAVAERLSVPERIEVRGTIEAERAAVLAARVMAAVTAIRVQAGDRVAAGQLLLEIDPRAVEGQVAQARGGLGQARAALALAERNAERFAVLRAADAASELELDLARLELERSRGALEQAEGAVAAAAALAGDSRLRAPFAGRVARVPVEVGDLAAPGRPLVLLESEGGRRLVLAVPESVVARAGLEVGARLQAAVDLRPDLGELAATVVERSPGADPVTHSFTVELELPAADLPTGAAGRAWVTVGEREAVAVPRQAVVRHGGLELVVVRQRDGRTGSRAVSTGRPLEDERIEILSGLAGSETVLVGLAALPAAGSPVAELP